MKTYLLTIPLLFLAGCFATPGDVRKQVDDNAAALRKEIAAVKAEDKARADKLAADVAAIKAESAARADKLAADVAAAKSESAASGDKLANLDSDRAANEKRFQTVEQQQKSFLDDMAALRADLKRISEDLARTIQDVQQKKEAAPAPAPAKPAPAKPAPAKPAPKAK